MKSLNCNIFFISLLLSNRCNSIRALFLATASSNHTLVYKWSKFLLFCKLCTWVFNICATLSIFAESLRRSNATATVWPCCDEWHLHKNLSQFCHFSSYDFVLSAHSLCCQKMRSHSQKDYILLMWKTNKLTICAS